MRQEEKAAQPLSQASLDNTGSPLFWTLTLASLLLLFAPTTVSACGGCYRLPYRTLLEKLELADRVVVALPADDDAERWKIVRVLKGDDAVDASIEFDRTNASNSPQLLRSTLDSWEIVASADLELGRFLIGAMSVSESANSPATVRRNAQQLRYFLPYLEHPDAKIADSTHAKFSSVPYAVLKEIAGEMDRAQLRLWIDTHSAAINKRVALFVMLLGVCGDQRDARQIKNWIDQGYSGGEIAYLTALLTAHIEFNGEQAVRFIEDAYIANHDRKLGEIIAAVDALRTHGQAETTVTRDRIKTSFHLLLRERAPLAELVIDDFSRWDDWSIADKLMQIHASGRQPWNHSLIIKYLQNCPLEKAKQYVQRADNNGAGSQSVQ